MTFYCKKSRLPKLEHLKNIIQQGEHFLHTEEIAHMPYHNQLWPIHTLSIGNQCKKIPSIFFVGGIHGVERIGTQVILALLENLVKRIKWDMSLQEELQHIRLVFIPLVNPIGMLKNSRANGNGVDLMRNSPVNAKDSASWLVGGQRISPFLPWYRGKKNHKMEIESAALTAYLKKELASVPFSIAIDCHSGFGFNNRIWFPYAKSNKPIPHLAEVYRLREMLHDSYPYQDYLFEPQSKNYTTHGDLWDHLYDISHNELQTTFIPLTLEMGSWNWIKKNPLQLFQSTGIFHPIRPHRIKRVLRQHHVLMEFLIKATRSHTQWSNNMNKEIDNARATSLWYQK